MAFGAKANVSKHRDEYQFLYVQSTSSNKVKIWILDSTRNHILSIVILWHDSFIKTFRTWCTTKTGQNSINNGLLQIITNDAIPYCNMFDARIAFRRKQAMRFYTNDSNDTCLWLSVTVLHISKCILNIVVRTLNYHSYWAYKKTTTKYHLTFFQPMRINIWHNFMIEKNPITCVGCNQ